MSSTVLRILSFSILAPVLLATSACTRGPRVEVITECPDGAAVVGTAPPEGKMQRCMLGDVRHGLSRSWFPSGVVQAERLWAKGQMHGAFTIYHENGRKRAQGAHRFGKPWGEWTMWDPQGKVEQHQNFGAWKDDPSETAAETATAAVEAAKMPALEASE